MAGHAPCKVIIVGDDLRTAEAVRLGFERDGYPVVATPETPPPIDESVGLIVASASESATALATLGRVIQVRSEGGRDVPVLYVGNGVGRRDALTAGADEVIGPPAFVRDVVTVGRMLASQPAETRGHWIGQLAETVGMYYLVRAIASLGRSGVLTLTRGLRRGEVRFFLGEVTSAQVGGLHGQAALHQLLLWTDGRFDFRREDVVRRRQIPLTPEELFADAERFLLGVREVAGGLSPASVLEQDARQFQLQGKAVPTEVYGVLRMFDGTRTLADVIEDSPYRVFETARVASVAVNAGLLRKKKIERPRSATRAALALEEWLSGETPDAVVEEPGSGGDSDGASGPTSAGSSSPGLPSGKSGRRKRRYRSTAPRPGRSTPAPPPSPPAIDWGALVPRGVAVDMHGLSQVVPSAQASGEIVPASRLEPREGLEGLSADARARLFPKEATIEVAPSTPPPTPPKVPPAPPAPEASEKPAPAASETEAALEAARVLAEEAARKEQEAQEAARKAKEAEEAAWEKAREEAEWQAAKAKAEAEAAETARTEAARTEREAEIARERDEAEAAHARDEAEAKAQREEALRRDEQARRQAEERVIDQARAAIASRDARGAVDASGASARGDVARGELNERKRPPSQPPPEPAVQPSILVDDLAAAHAAVASVVSAQVARPKTLDASGDAPEDTGLISGVRRDARAQVAAAATHFSEIEEQFFDAGHHGKPHEPEEVESFADLDEGYQPTGFWKRLFGGKRRR